MSSSKSEQSSTTTNITETITPTLVTSQGSNTSVIAENFTGEIGLTGSDAVRALSDFQDLQRDTALLNAQVTTNALVAASKGPVGTSFVSPAVSGGGGGGETPADNSKKIQTAVLLLGGASAVVTIFALRK